MNFDKELIEIFGEENVKKAVPMKEQTTFKIGGPAEYLVTPRCKNCLKKGIEFCKANGIPFTIIGNGSNLLVSDNGISGVVFKICGCIDAVEYEEKGDELIITAGAGIMLIKLALEISGKGYTGFEFASGIPGTLGGAVFMNAGAYGGEINDVIVSAEVLTKEGEFRTYSKEELNLSYRHSAVMENGDIVISACLKAVKGDKSVIDAQIEELKGKRREKQPLEFPSAGSTFKRPTGYFAGKLIEDSGLKGYTVGGAQVSMKHAGFVINIGNATAKDVTDLIKDVHDKVLENYGVEMEPEVRMLGF